MALTLEQQTEIDAAIAKAKAELKIELAKTQTAADAWITAHPVLAFRVGVVLGILGGGSAVFAVLHIL